MTTVLFNGSPVVIYIMPRSKQNLKLDQILFWKLVITANPKEIEHKYDGSEEDKIHSTTENIPKPHSNF